MKNKIILITGATSGIGKVTSTELAKAGAHIIIIARNKEKAISTQQEIAKETGNNNIDIFIADLSSLQQVRKVAGEINGSYSRIDISINNAGFIATSQRKESADGNELTLATNHLGPFLLTALLFPLIKKSAEGRIINLSSEAHKLGSADFNNIQLLHNYSAMKAYCNSKLYNLLFTKELDKRIKEKGLNIKVNAVHPGVVNTGFGKRSDGFAGFIFKKLAFLFTTPQKGAETTIYLATSHDGAQISGEYFKNKKQVRTNSKPVNEKNEKELWDISEKLTGEAFL